MKTWESRVRQQFDAAQVQTRIALRDALPAFLITLSQVLLPAHPADDVCETSDVCREHGEERANLAEYSLEEVMGEYRTFREVIFELLEAEKMLLPQSRNIILDSIQNGMKSAASEFVKIHRLQDLKTVQTLENERDLRETFVQTLTHDLRNPLTAAKMSAQLILRKAEHSDFIHKQASRVIQNVDRADEMIRDLLDANRIRAGQPLPLQLAECDLQEVLVGTLDDLTTLFGNRFVLESPPSLTGCWDCASLQRVIENLCNNAIKYGDKREPIRVTLSEKKNSKVELLVNNQGAPISSEDQTKLWQAFHRTESAQQSGLKGWGIGLTVVKGLVEAHGGTVDLESTLENGTTFSVSLPRDSRLFQSIDAYTEPKP